MTDYSWITDEMFAERLRLIIDEEITAAELLAIAGIYEILSEEFNDMVLDELTEERETGNRIR